MRLLDPKRRASSWIVTRKTSQDSNLSSSRNDSSGSATTNSTTMSRVSRSSNSSEIRPKPRLTRQSAVQEDCDLPGSPARLTVRFLTTIPSAAETSVQHEEEAPCYAILHASAEPSPNTSQNTSPNLNSNNSEKHQHQ
jgi:leucine-rich repeat-containing G protein-coupled receptor 6